MFWNNSGQNTEEIITGDLTIKTFQTKSETKSGPEFKDKLKTILRNM